MSFLWGKKDDAPSSQSQEQMQDPNLAENYSMPSSPLFALDQLKASGIPLKAQMTPYLQMDPSAFAKATPQIIMPEGYEQGRGKFEMALGFIGAGVGAGYATGCSRGFLFELANPETKKLLWKPWRTRLLNATSRYGGAYAQTIGTIAFIYSALEIGTRTLRGADDPLNAMAAGLLTGGLYRISHGPKNSAIGAAVGLVSALALELLRKDYDRIDEMISKTRTMFKT